MTDGVVRDTKSQGLSKAMFSGEGLFVHHVSGTGVVFVTSLGAIIQRNLRQGEQWIVDNGHLVAWNCPYAIERSGGGIMSGAAAGEGLVCRFTGPGTVFIQVNSNSCIERFDFIFLRLDTKSRIVDSLDIRLDAGKELSDESTLTTRLPYPFDEFPFH